MAKRVSKIWGHLELSCVWHDKYTFLLIKGHSCKEFRPKFCCPSLIHVMVTFHCKCIISERDFKNILYRSLYNLFYIHVFITYLKHISIYLFFPQLGK